MSRGKTYFSHKQYSKAIETFSKEINLDPHNGEAYYYRSLSYYLPADKWRTLANFQKDFPGSSRKDMIKIFTIVSFAIDTHRMNKIPNSLKSTPGFASIEKLCQEFLLFIRDSNKALEIDPNTYKPKFYTLYKSHPIILLLAEAVFEKPNKQ